MGRCWPIFLILDSFPRLIPMSNVQQVFQDSLKRREFKSVSGQNRVHITPISWFEWTLAIVHTGLERPFSAHSSIFQDFLKLSKSRNQSDFEQHLLQQQYKLRERNVRTDMISVIFSPWNSLLAKNTNYRTLAYKTIIKYYRNDSSKSITIFN